MFKTLFISFFIGFAFVACNSQNGGIKTIDVNTFAAGITKEKKVQLVDVRTPQEFATGYINGAVNMDYYAANFQEQLTKLDKNTPVYLYCKSSGRSVRAGELLAAQGYKEVYVLQGGMMGWAAANKEIATGAAPSQPVADAYTAAMLDAELKSNKAVLVDYYAEWCIPCKRMEPLLSKLQKEYAGKVKILRINVDQAPALVKQQGIAAIPYLVTYKTGVKKDVVNEEADETKLRQLVKNILP